MGQQRPHCPFLLRPTHFAATLIQGFTASCLLRSLRRTTALTTRAQLERLVPHGVGASGDSTRLRSLLASMCESVGWHLNRVRHSTSFTAAGVDTGALPGRCAFALGAAVFHGFPQVRIRLSSEWKGTRQRLLPSPRPVQRGGAYPRGGPAAPSAELVRCIEAAGGRVLTRARVSAITLSDDGQRRVTGVIVAPSAAGKAGTSLTAPLVVSAVGYVNTVRLLPTAAAQAAGLPPRPPGVPDSAGFVMVNLGLRGTAAELGLTPANAIWLPVDDRGDMCAALDAFWAAPFVEEAVGAVTSQAARDAARMPVFVSFPSVKDAGGCGAADKARLHTAQILIIADAAWFERWSAASRSAAKSGGRGADYAAFKSRFAAAARARLGLLFPRIIPSAVVFEDVSTPLSIGDWLGASGGGAVGLEHCPERFSDAALNLLDPHVKAWKSAVALCLLAGECLMPLLYPHMQGIPGLWMTGQDTLLCGQPLAQVCARVFSARVPLCC